MEKQTPKNVKITSAIGLITYFSTVENLLLVSLELRASFVSCPVYTAQPIKSH
jgi:hypothetical protein